MLQKHISVFCKLEIKFTKAKLKWKIISKGHKQYREKEIKIALKHMKICSHRQNNFFSVEMKIRPRRFSSIILANNHQSEFASKLLARLWRHKLSIVENAEWPHFCGGKIGRIYCYRFNCVLLPYTEVLISVSQNVTLFGDRFFTKAIKLKWGHRGRP